MKEINGNKIVDLATEIRDVADELCRIAEMSVDDIFCLYGDRYKNASSEHDIRDLTDRFVLSYGRFTLRITGNTFSWGFEYPENLEIGEVLDTFELVGGRHADLTIRMDNEVWQSIYPTHIDPKHFDQTSIVSETQVESYVYAKDLMEDFILSNRPDVIDSENKTPRPEWNLFRDHVQVVCRNLKRKEG